MARILVTGMSGTGKSTVLRVLGFYPRFDQVVLLSASVEVILGRIEARTDNPYGKSAEERAEIIGYLAEVEPLLRASADVEIDTSGPLADVVEQVRKLADGY